MIIHLGKDVTKNKTEEELSKIIVEILKGNISYPGIIIQGDTEKEFHDTEIKVELLKIKYDLKGIKRTLASIDAKYGHIKNYL